MRDNLLQLEKEIKKVSNYFKFVNNMSLIVIWMTILNVHY